MTTLKLLTSTLLIEGITHIEDLPLRDFVHAVETLKDKVVTEKLDGSNLWFGVDESGRFFTSREGKARKGTRFYSVSDYPNVASYNGFRAAHLALEKEQASIKRHLQKGDMVEIEVLFGRQPNTVTYGNSEKNFIVILRGVETKQEKVDSLAKALNGRAVKVKSNIISSEDGEKLQSQDVEQTWEFTQVKPVDTKQVDIAAALEKLKELRAYLKQPNGKIANRTNLDVAEISLTSVDKDKRAAVKAEREAQLDYIMKNFKEPIKEILLDTLVRKVKPFLQTHDLDPSEDIGVEGVVARDEKSGDMIKIVDKDVFTAINTFNNAIRNNIAGLVRTDDQDAPIELRGGAFGQAKIRIGNLLGMKELALSSSTRKLLTKFKGTTPEETAQKLARSMDIVSFNSTKTKISAILTNSLEEINDIINDFKSNAASYKLELKTGKEIGISPEVMKRNLTAFAETKRDINQINTAVQKSRNVPELVMALYGRTIQSLFSGSTIDVKESFNLIKTFEDGEGGGEGDVPAEVPMATVAGSIAPVEKKLLNGKMITRRKRRYVKKKKFARVKEGASLLQMFEFDTTNQFARDVDDSSAAKTDVEFKSLRNNMKIAGDNVDQSDVGQYLDKAHELNDEVDTVIFGMEMDDGSVVKVYVNATQADEFEKILAELLGEEDDVEKVIDDLANSFDIVDVEWPNEAMIDGETPVATNDEGEITNGEDGQIDAMTDANGEQTVDPVIDINADEENTDSDTSDAGLLKQIAGQVDDNESKDGEEETGAPADDTVINLDDNPDKDDEGGGADTTDDTAPASDELGIDNTVFGDEDESGTTDEPAAGGEEEASPEENEDEEPVTTDEAPPDEEGNEETADDETPEDGEEPKAGGKKKKKKAAEEEPSATPQETEESVMSFGQRFKEKVLVEKAAPKAKVPEKEVAAEEAHEFPAEVKKLMTEFPTRGAKMMVGLMHTLGAPLDAMIMKKGDLKKAVETAGDLYMKDSQFRLWTKRVIDSVMKAQSPMATEGLEQEMSNVLQKIVLGILKKIGMVEGIEKMARSALRANVKNIAALAQHDNHVRTNLKVLGEMLGVDGTGMVKEDELTEAKNHMGDAEYQTYDAWRRACKKIAPKGHMDGDKDIGEWHVGANPFKAGKTWAIGEWGGDKGSIYKDAAEIVAKANAVEEAVATRDWAMPPGGADGGADAWVATVKKLATTLGIPESNVNYRENMVDMALKKRKLKITNYAMVQRKIEQLLELIGTVKEDEEK
jgi:hypothetical protein